MHARLSCTRANTVTVWFQHDQNAPKKISTDPDIDINDLKQYIFGKTDKEKYQAMYNGELLIPSAKIPQDTTDKNEPLIPSAKVPQDTTKEMPIVFINIVNRRHQEFTIPGTRKELNCYGRPCAKCHKCRDWHFTGDQDQWNWVCSYKNWKDADLRSWRNDKCYKLFTKRHDGATCFHHYHHYHRHYHFDHVCLCEKH